MNISTRVENNTLYIDLEGRLDTITSQDLMAALPLEKRDRLDIEFNFEKLQYLSSAGLRLLVVFQKDAVETSNKLVVKNINDVVKEIFSVTGFDKILTIE